MQSNRLHPVTSLPISSAPLFDIPCSPPPPNQVNRITSPASLPSPLRSPFKANLKLDDLHTRVEGGPVNCRTPHVVLPDAESHHFARSLCQRNAFPAPLSWLK